MTDEEKAKEIENAIYYYRPQTDRERKLIELLVEEKIKARQEGRKETFSEAVIKNLKENTSVINSVIMGKLSEKCEQLEKENADLEYKLKCREDELAEITANRPARWNDESKRELQIILRLIAEIFQKHKIPFMLDLRNMRIKTGNCEKRLMVDTTPELLAVAGYYRYQIDQIHDRYIKNEKDFLEQKAWYEGEIKRLKQKTQI